jgi:hypothetical protein
MVRISISELSPAGADLFSESENFMDSVRDLSLEELKATKGGGGSGSKKKKKSKSGSGKKKHEPHPHPCYHCP